MNIRKNNTRLIATFGGILLALLTGCEATTGLQLTQPFAPPAQRVLNLEARAAYLSETDGQRRVVAEYPLPGSFAGPRAFVLFLDMPRSSQSIPIAPGNGAARGFLVQEVGELAGKSALVGGSVMCLPVFMSENSHELRIDANCEDGTRLSGTITTRLDDARIRQFRTQFAGDIAALERPAIATDPEAADDAVIETQRRTRAKNSEE